MQKLTSIFKGPLRYESVQVYDTLKNKRGKKFTAVSKVSNKNGAIWFRFSSEFGPNVALFSEREYSRWSHV